MPLLLLLLPLPLAPFVATFGLIVVNLFNIDGAIFVVDFTVVLLVGISVLISVDVAAVNVTVAAGDGIVVGVVFVVVVDAIFAAVVDGSGSIVLVLLTNFDTLGITAFDVTF